MSHFSMTGNQKIDEIAARHGFSADAVVSMLGSVRAGHGRMAQFAHPEFGGSGQWMRGGMTMISDMFNAALKARVERLCDELATLIAKDAAGADRARSDARNREARAEYDGSRPDEAAGAGAEAERLLAEAPTGAHDDWWPPELGRPDSTGAQNAARYAYFAGPRRLAIDADGRVTIYDTLDHRISGISQQQSARGSVTFSSSQGNVDVASLPIVSGASEPSPAPDVFATIEKLAELRSKGVLSDAEFATKKAELLSRL